MIRHLPMLALHLHHPKLTLPLKSVLLLRHLLVTKLSSAAALEYSTRSGIHMELKEAFKLEHSFPRLQVCHDPKMNRGQ
jgi:hypothetical protein